MVVARGSQVFNPLERRDLNLGPMVVDRPTTGAIPSCFANPNGFANPNRFADRTSLGFAIAKINGFRWEFSQAGRKVDGFGMDAAFPLGIRQDKRVPIRFSPKRSRVVAGFGVSAAFSGGIAMINGFNFDFPQIARESPVLA